MQKAKLSILISILLLTFTLNSFAQTDSSQIDLKGKWALQFQITSGFTLNEFQGGTFSGKYHFTNNSAIRFGLTSRYVSKDNELSQTIIYPDTTSKSDHDGELSSNAIEIALQYLHYFEMSNSISAFCGAGLNYYTSPYSNELKDLKVETKTNFGYGLNLLMGVEWFVRSNIGINAEYGIRFGYSYEEYASERTYSYNDEKRLSYSKSSGFALYSPRVKFGLSIYF